MGLVIDKTLTDDLLDESKVKTICKHCGQIIIVSTNMYEDICPHCGQTFLVDEVLEDTTINITVKNS